MLDPVEIKKMFIEHLEEQIIAEVKSCVDFDGERQNLHNALQLCRLLRNLRQQRMIEDLLVKLAKLQPRKKFHIKTEQPLNCHHYKTGEPTNIIRDNYSDDVVYK